MEALAPLPALRVGMVVVVRREMPLLDVKVTQVDVETTVLSLFGSGSA